MSNFTCVSSESVLEFIRVRALIAAFAFLLYAVQLVWTIGSAGFFLAIDRNALKQLSTSPVLSGESEAPSSAASESDSAASQAA